MTHSPLAAWDSYYVIIGSSAGALTALSPPFMIAGAALLLVFIGIHHAWDSAAYVAAGRPAASSQS